MADTLLKLSNELASTVEAAGPGVVRVEARRRLPASGIIWSAEGVIVAAHHVVEQDDNIRVGLASGETVAATLVGRDPTTDLAVLRAQAPGFTPPTWSEADSLRVGHLVLALGRPGRTVLATLGIVSALGNSWRTPTGGRLDHYLQTDAAMYPGFSGGPLVDTEGRIIGLNTTALRRGTTVTITTPTVRRVVETLLAHGRVQRGYLGVAVQPARLPEALAGRTGQETGLLVVSVESASPGEKGGLLLGDTLLSLDGQPLRYPDDLVAQLSGERIGTSVPIRLVRGGQIQEMRVAVGERS
jgi:S1-C subfamily serine protease